MIPSLSVALQLRIPASGKVFTQNHGQIKVSIFLVSSFESAEESQFSVCAFYSRIFISSEVMDLLTCDVVLTLQTLTRSRALMSTVKIGMFEKSSAL